MSTFQLSSIEKYLQQRLLRPLQFDISRLSNIELIITIPSFAEPNLQATLSSINAVVTDIPFAVMILLNNGAEHPDEVQLANSRMQKWLMANADTFNFPLLFAYKVFSSKKAGVGMARKVLMDEACAYFYAQNNLNGIITALDADTTVQPNYVNAIYDFYQKNPSTIAASIQFEHPTEGDDFDANVYKGIILYELHLRYYNQALKKAGLRTAYQTVGSAMSVRADAYAAFGGMNQKKAGEDFYFLHKFTAEAFGEIQETIVTPSPRLSERVPFGTGKAIGKFLQEGFYESYDPKTFEDLAVFLTQIYTHHKLSIDLYPDSVQAFLRTVKFEGKIAEIDKNSKGKLSFDKRFSKWFNAFMAMKYAHFCRDTFYPNLPVETAASKWVKTFYPRAYTTDPKELLAFFRELEKQAD